MSGRKVSLLLLLLLSALAVVACERRPPPEDLRPEITVENIREDINGQRVRLPAEAGASEPSTWRFFLNEPKEIEILGQYSVGLCPVFRFCINDTQGLRA